MLRNAFNCLFTANHGATRNTSIESREGEVKSPNFPAPYGEGNHFRLHIKAPNSTSDSERVVVHFKHIDIEFQENCLYDYLGLQSRESGPMQKICGLHTTNLDRYVLYCTVQFPISCIVDIPFHSFVFRFISIPIILLRVCCENVNPLKRLYAL